MDYTRMLNNNKFNIQQFTNEVELDTYGYNNLFNNYTYMFRGNIVSLGKLIFELIPNVIMEVFPENYNNVKSNTIYTCMADGKISYNFRSDTFYFISAESKHVFSLTLSQLGDCETSAMTMELNNKAYEMYNINNLFKRISHKAYKKHANELILYVIG